MKIPEQKELTPAMIDHNGQPVLAIKPDSSGPVFIDFTGGKKAHRRQFGGGKNQPLPRAIGLSSKKPLRVLDATAGMGADSFVLASLGCYVTMIERSKSIAALLQDGLDRALNDASVADIIKRLTLVSADSTQYLLTNKPDVDTIYMDPMYPEKKKKASPKKEMKLLQALVGPDKDSEALLAAALSVAKKRVVVKRPKNAPYVNLQKPSMEITSPNTRYDVYVIAKLD